MDWLDYIAKNSEKSNNKNCWLWKGKKDQHGYGIINGWWPNGTKFRHKIHELSFMLTKDKFVFCFNKVKQTCGNKLCANPDHLEV